MSRKMFIYKELNSDDRDIVKYVERPTFDCGHYFGNIGLTGACFSMGLEFPKDIKTILTKKEINLLLNAQKEIGDLGYSINVNSRNYKKGLKILADIEPIFVKLEGKENEKLFEEIIEEEKEYLKEEYYLSDKEVEEIFDNYYLGYRDRGIVGRIYEDVEELGQEEAETYIENLSNFSKYFDYEAFGQDLVSGDNYLELSSGRCVYLCY